MASKDLTIAMILLLQTTVGVLGNFSLLCHYHFLYFSGHKLRSTDLILRHLTVANSMVLLCRGIPGTIAALGLKDFLSDFGCKFLFYVHRVGRGVSIGSTCLLSTVQAITISPRNPRWAELKVKSRKYIGFSIFLCWLLHMLVNIVIPMYVTSNCSNQTIPKEKVYGYCSSDSLAQTASLLFAAMLSFPDIVSLGLMLWASSSMLVILHRHKQQVQHIHRNNISPRSSPETRATQTILVLVSIFVSFYTLSCIFQVLTSVSHPPSWWMVNAGVVTAAGFPMVSPFFLMSHDSSFSRFCFAPTLRTTDRNIACCCMIPTITFMLKPIVAATVSIHLVQGLPLFADLALCQAGARRIEPC